ncbi:MAG: flagellar hook-basal body complex protein FliE [Succinivibrio sp.]
MSIGISSAAPSGSILAGLQNMQRQMNALSAAAGKGADEQFHVYSQALQAKEPESVQEAQGAQDGAGESSASRVGAFEQALKEAFENVNNLQNNAANLQTRFDTGDRQVTLSDVMLATQKSNISFEAAVQIRNKLIEAYKTVSQMQI